MQERVKAIIDLISFLMWWVAIPFMLVLILFRAVLDGVSRFVMSNNNGAAFQSLATLEPQALAEVMALMFVFSCFCFLILLWCFGLLRGLMGYRSHYDFDKSIAGMVLRIVKPSRVNKQTGAV